MWRIEDTFARALIVRLRNKIVVLISLFTIFCI